MKKCPYLSPWAENEKNKDTLLSQTFKIEENKVALFFSFLAHGPRYGLLFYFDGKFCAIFHIK